MEEITAEPSNDTRVNWNNHNVQGYAGERFDLLDGMEVRFEGETEIGVISQVKLDRRNRQALIYVRFTPVTGPAYVRVGLIHQLELVNPLHAGKIVELLKGEV